MSVTLIYTQLERIQSRSFETTWDIYHIELIIEASCNSLICYCLEPFGRLAGTIPPTLGVAGETYQAYPEKGFRAILGIHSMSDLIPFERLSGTSSGHFGIKKQSGVLHGISENDPVDSMENQAILKTKEAR